MRSRRRDAPVADWDVVVIVRKIPCSVNIPVPIGSFHGLDISLSYSPNVMCEGVLANRESPLLCMVNHSP